VKLIELHILQSFPVTCLNRDDLGSPKSAVFGGVTRARISSQCLKRAIRMQAKEICPDLFKGERSRLIVEQIKKAVTKKDIEEALALDAAKKLCDHLAKFDTQAEKSKGMLKVKTLMFLSPAEIAQAGEELAAAVQNGAVDDKKIKDTAKRMKDVKLKDAADIALFGRMVASDHSLSVEGAALFSHALSTHRAESDVDFFTAVDDRQKEDPSVMDEDRAGSGMMGTLEYNSATYYRYVGLNVDMLWDEDHLRQIQSKEDRERILNAFLRACLMAVPSARRNSMNGSTLPGYVLGLVRDKSYPLQLVNAFEQPVRPKQDGLLEPSVKALKDHFEHMKKSWDLNCAGEVELPHVPLPEFCKTLLSHV